MFHCQDFIFQMQDEQFLRAVLLARIEDENPAVVLTVLKDAEVCISAIHTTSSNVISTVILLMRCEVTTARLVF